MEKTIESVAKRNRRRSIETRERTHARGFVWKKIVVSTIERLTVKLFPEDK